VAVAILSHLATASTGLAAQSTCDRDGWAEVISVHLTRYPLLGVEDAYKLLHQGVFGAEHAAPDLASAGAMLEEELRALGQAADVPAPLAESIAPGGRVARVHLRPYRAAGGDPEALLVAFVQTAATVRGGIEELRCAVEVVEEAAAGRWAPGVWRDFVGRMIAEGLPAIRHSGPYEAVYRPAYRVVAGDLLPGPAAVGR
jgi:hypothetical protein